MKILVLNAGSSTLKYQLYEAKTEKVLVKGVAERIGTDGRFTQKLNGNTSKQEIIMKNHSEALKIVLDSLVKNNIVSSLDEISAVGHRVVHGGEMFTESVLITNEVEKGIKDLVSLAPLHQPSAILAIDAVKKLMPKVPQVAVFDTAFHSTLPDYAYRYAIGKEAYTKWGIRRYGFHGSSHRYIAKRLEDLVGKKGKFIICHIGNGASISAVKNGKCIETSMGYTPLEGLMMGTRSGDIDPSVVQRIMKETKMNIDEAINYLNKKCGLLGISGVSEDMRDLEAHVFGKDKDSEVAKDCLLAMKMDAYRVKKYIGSYAAVLGGVDAIAFTAGVGENGNEFREMCLEGLDFLGIKLDKNKNGKNFVRGKEQMISKSSSPVKVFVIPTDEELVIMRDTKSIVNKIKK